MAPLTLALAGARLRAARGRQLALVLALGLAAVIPIVVGASSALTASAVLQRALGQLPAGDRSVIVSFNGRLDPADSADTDRVVRSRLAGLGAQPVSRQIEFRELADGGGGVFVLAAADGLAGRVRVIDGRLPRTCTPGRCEVVTERADGVADPDVADPYGLVVVGHVVRTDPLFLTGTFAPPAGVTLVFADGVENAASVTPLALIQRSYGWVAPLGAAAVTASGGVTGWVGRATAAADQLMLTRPGLTLVTPDAALSAQAARADESAGRFGLLAGSCAVLLLGAAVVGGAALRPDQTRFVAALRRRGLSANRIRGVVALETAAVALAGTAAGLLMGFGVAAVLATGSELPVWATAGASVRSALPGVLGLAAAAWAVLLVSLWPNTNRPSYAEQRTAWRFVTASAVAGLVAVLLVVSRGGAVTGTPGSSGSPDPLVVVLPALVLLTLGLGTARLWPWAVRAAYARLPRRAPGLRLGVAGISGRPMLAAATVGLLAAGVGATGFAASYRSTLLQGAADQAAFAVPFDARVVPGAGLAPVLTSASVQDYGGVAPGARASPVLRQAASIRSGPKAADVVQMLGVEPGALPLVQRWSRVVGGSDPASVARSITLPARTSAGRELPAGQSLSIRVTGAPPVVVLTAALRAADGTERTLELNPVASPAGTRLTGALPALPNGTKAWSLQALSVRQTFQDETRRGHGLGESETDRELPSGRIVLAGMSVDAQDLPSPWSGWTGSGLRISDGGNGAVLDYRLESSILVLRPALPALGSAESGQPLPVAADPVTARQGPVLTITLNGQPISARVVATLPRMPTVTGRFVVSDLTALSALVDSHDPGLGQPGEVWLDVPGASATGQAKKALGAPPFTGVRVEWASDMERSLRTDPVAEGAVQLLVLAAALTMLVALAALVLLVVSERFEDAGELFTWEADGVAPAVLRRGLWVRAALVAVVAVPAGVAGGLVLTRLTAALVGLTAGAQQPNPPLVAETGAGAALPAIVVGLVLALAVAALIAASALREPRPVGGPKRWGVS